MHTALATGHASPNSQSVNPSYPYQHHQHVGAAQLNTGYTTSEAVDYQAVDVAALEFHQQRIQLQNLQILL